MRRSQVSASAVDTSGSAPSTSAASATTSSASARSTVSPARRRALDDLSDLGAGRRADQRGGVSQPGGDRRVFAQASEVIRTNDDHDLHVRGPGQSVQLAEELAPDGGVMPEREQLLGLVDDEQAQPIEVESGRGCGQRRQRIIARRHHRSPPSLAARQRPAVSAARTPA